MRLIDTHTHIYLEEFDEDQDEMLQRAEKEQVEYLLLPAIDRLTHDRLFDLETRSSFCHAMMGLHPCSVKADYRDELKAAREFLESRKFVAVGEIGLDFYWDKTFTDQQYKAFHEQLEWAVHFGIPVSIHSRNATAECIEVVKEHQKGKLKGIFHCFSGDTRQASEIIEAGLFLGIGGVITFKNSGLDRVMNEISIKHAVLETDAPYLAPVPFRGKRNEPSYLKYVVEKLAEVTNSTTEKIAEITTGNAEKIFGL
jgi:TatD DNase family protein